ncbi:MAG: MarR family transcriptional regulator [Fimbriimonadales bacterium]|nr:MarR family transcriptional regulator [Fimbriimonadales bacterium]MDW8052701.1 MarR family transcriptional regulator [Armatimonadota bacterium]
MRRVKETVKLPIALTDELLSHAELVARVFLQAMYTSIGEKLLEELAESDLTYSQMQALRYLNTHKRVTVGDLAEGLNISYPSATNMVHRLERKALIRRVANPRDRRQVGLTLTEAGRELIQRVDHERRQRFAAILARMSQAERQAFINGLSAFIRAGVETGMLKAYDVCLQCGTDADPNCPLVEMHAVEACR